MHLSQAQFWPNKDYCFLLQYALLSEVDYTGGVEKINPVIQYGALLGRGKIAWALSFYIEVCNHSEITYTIRS